MFSRVKADRTCHNPIESKEDSWQLTQLMLIFFRSQDFHPQTWDMAGSDPSECIYISRTVELLKTWFDIFRIYETFTFPLYHDFSVAKTYCNLDDKKKMVPNQLSLTHEKRMFYPVVKVWRLTLVYAGLLYFIAT